MRLPPVNACYPPVIFEQICEFWAQFHKFRPRFPYPPVFCPCYCPDIRLRINPCLPYTDDSDAEFQNSPVLSPVIGVYKSAMISEKSRSLHFCFTLAIAACLVALPSAAQQAPATAPPGRCNPVADPRAIVTLGNARFTVLTPQLIRMEWAADGKFEDHASFVFLNRLLPVPKFTHLAANSGGTSVHVIRTEALSLSYTVAYASDGKFSADNLRIDFILNGKQMSWHPGMEDAGNLQGTTRTLDGAQGDKTKEPIDPGLI